MTRPQPMKCPLAGLPYVYGLIYCLRRVLAFVVSTCKWWCFKTLDNFNRCIR